MAFDINGQYTGSLYGRDRIGHTTPDCEATEVLRPWLPVGYPAPWLPAQRRDQGHPVQANVVISSQQLLGQDKSGALVPAGYFSGNTGTNAGHATGGGYCAIQYSADDVGFTYNPQTGVRVAVAGETVVLAAPSSAVNTDVITFPNGSTHTITNGDITFAQACNLFPVGAVKPIGVALRNVFQYLGETDISSSTNGILYTLNGVIPTKFAVHNYMHEMATAIQTQYVLRMPWIGATPTTLATLATGAGVTGYTQSDYSRSFTHFTGTKGLSAGQLFNGCLVVGSRGANGKDAGNYAPYDSSVHSVDDICGRVLAIMNMYPIRDFANRVRTLWDPNRMVGPIRDPNPASIMMGGSATAGVDYQINLGTDGLFKRASDQGVAPFPEMSTYVFVRVNL